MFVKIKGTGSCLPEKVLDNFEISQLVDTNDEWIQSRTESRAAYCQGRDSSFYGSESGEEGIGRCTGCGRGD